MLRMRFRYPPMRPGFRAHDSARYIHTYNAGQTPNLSAITTDRDGNPRASKAAR
ncbi:MAG: hypothetical protein LBK13_09770 [Spirochaetales bacterium]|nr:hypothetical protein [Spirochaetales bacterium]